MKQLNFFDELIVDNFAGGGGTSTGIEFATGRPVDIAINHDPDAVLMHKTNHPHTRHYCESVWDVNPKEICAGHPVGLMWLSPDCKHFSRAKGGKPVSKNIRGLDKFTIKSDKPFIVAIGQTGYSENRQYDINSPLTTVLSKNEHCLCTPHISKYYGGVTGSKADEPLSTVTAIDHNAIVAPYLIQYHSETSKHEVRGQKLDKPLMTVDGSGRYGFIESHLCVLRKNMDCKSLNEPLPTITTSGGHFAEIRTCIAKYNKDTDLGHWEKVRELLNTYCDYKLSADEILLFEINNELYFLSDIGMRMLEPRELYNAQGFPKDYIIDHDYKGNTYPRTKQVARCGNAVPPPFAEALVRANLPEMCGQLLDWSELNND